MNLKEAALAASKERATESRDRRTKEREDSLTHLLEGTGYKDKPVWDAQFGGFEPVPERPARESFVYCRHLTSGYRAVELHGWQFEIDGVPFLYSTTHGHQSTYVLLTCPDCGSIRAEHFYGLDSLGTLIRAQRGHSHTCLEVEARRLAYAIGQAARDANTTPARIVDHATRKHYDTILKALRS